ADFRYALEVVLRLAGLEVIAALAAIMLLRRTRVEQSIQTWVPAAVMAVFAAGFLAWLPDWIDFGLGEAGGAGQVPAAVVAALGGISRIAPAKAVIATNQHSLSGMRNRPERSYMILSLAQRPVLLEGWQYGEMNGRGFETVARDNERLFTTTDPAEFAAIAS